MKRAARAPLRLESLEKRECPAVVVKVYPTLVQVRGIPNGDLEVTGTGTPYQFTIKDNGSTLGTFTLGGSLLIQTPSRPGSISIDLNSTTIGGNVILDLGNGGPGTDDEVEIFDADATTGLGTGTIRGNLTIINGSGQENVYVGANFTAPSTVDSRPVTVRGNVTAAGRTNRNLLDTFVLGEDSNVRGNISTSQYEDVTIGFQDVSLLAEQTVIGGNINITLSGASQGLTANFYGVAGRNITVNGATSTPGFNTFNIAPGDPGIDSLIRGNVTATLGPAITANAFVIQAGAGTETTVIQGNVRLSSPSSTIGSLADFVVLDGTVRQSVWVNMGAGDNDLTFSGQIDGSLYYTGGNGENNFGTGGTNVFDGILAQNLYIRVGNGDNNISVQTAVGNTFTIRAGSGQNAVDILPTAATIYTVDFIFGNGDNTVTLNSDVSISGLCQGGTGTNTLAQNSAIFLPLFTYPNFTVI
ncbi:MAG: hypothetical protein U0840_11580 [Gemmataceae bacterium]